MKKSNYIFLASAILVSCVQEHSFDDVPPVAENGIAFMFHDSPTRSDAVKSKQGVSLAIGRTENGEALFLEETIENLNPTLATKGSPAYTGNVGTLYSTMGVFADGNFGDVSFGVMDDSMFDNKDESLGKGWRYQHVYPDRPWPESDDEKVDFYLNMPAAPSGVSITSRANKKIQFSYDGSELGTAIAQQDILFSHTSLSKNDHDGFLPYGAPVMMYHALSGVKFRQGWANDTGTKTIITSVKWFGLKSKGTCTISPQSTPIVDWTVDNTSTGTQFSQEFTNEAWSATPGADGTVGDSAHPWNPDLEGTSWTSAASDKNLNDADGSWTFWFVPQEIDENVTLEVSFLIKTRDTPNGKEEITYTLNFGEVVNEGRTQNIKWEAGQLRTYTLKPLHVDLDVFDDMDDSKFVKSNLHITNTGNVDQYVRVYIIGNWVGKRQTSAGVYNDYETILMGYTDNTKDAITGDYVNYNEVARWNDKDFKWNGTNKVYSQWSSPSATYTYTPYGDFVGLPEMGSSSSPGASNGKNWIRHDKFYYYTEIIGPGGRVPETDPLFESYTIGPSPDFWIADMTGERRLAKDVHFVMDIAVQAIAVPYNGDTPVGYEDAWKAALGVSDINDL